MMPEVINDMAARSHILIVDDDADIRQVLRLLLREDYNVSEAEDGPAAIRAVKENADIDLIILDVMMPGMSGWETCDALRALTNAPVLFLTAKSAEKDRLAAYRSGGDDFLSKPFSHDELLAKVGSLLRRYKEYRGKPEAALAVENLEIDFAAHSVRNAGTPVQLTDTEYAILEYLLHNRGTTVTTPDLDEAVWKERFLPGSGNTVMVHVLNLRRKIEDNPSSPKIVRAVWGKGYQID